MEMKDILEDYQHIQRGNIRHMSIPSRGMWGGCQLQARTVPITGRFVDINGHHSYHAWAIFRRDKACATLKGEDAREINPRQSICFCGEDAPGLASYFIQYKNTARMISTKPRMP